MPVSCTVMFDNHVFQGVHEPDKPRLKRRLERICEEEVETIFIGNLVIEGEKIPGTWDTESLRTMPL